MGLAFIILRVAMRKGQQMHLGGGAGLFSIMTGKKWLQECEAACFLLLFILKPQPMVWCSLRLEWVFLPGLIQSHKRALRFVS